MHLFHYLLLLFIVVPVVELSLLLSISGVVGAVRTFVIIIITGIIGAHLAKQQGIKTLNTIKSSLNQGHLPGTEVVDGFIILIAGAVLLTPGFLTDVIGFLLLLPSGRNVFKAWLIKRFTKFLQSGRVKPTFRGYRFETKSRHESDESPDDDVIDVEGKNIDS